MQNDINTPCAAILKNLSITALTAMQEAVIEKSAAAGNLVVLSPTGSGKTLAFLIAVLNGLEREKQGVQALVVTPSRELALQIEQVFRDMKTAYKVSCCYGGHAVRIEENSLREAPALIIGTPGRLADHLGRNSFDASTVNRVVLDEFDKSLQLGFHAQLKTIFNALSGKQQHLLTSATKLKKLPDFLPFTKAETLDYLEEEADSRLRLKLLRTRSVEKAEGLLRLVAGFNQESCLVFCNHREAVQRISAVFQSHHFEHGIFHGAMEQADREKSLIRFRGGASNVLIATDLAARGLDIPEVRHIVHYQLPPKEDAFIHRNGRTARMHADGEAYLILADDETLPDYISRATEEIDIDGKLHLPPPPQYVCLYISAGRKEKVNKGDIVGWLMKKGGLQSEDIGLVTALDHASYVSVKRPVVNELLAVIKNEKLKKMKVRTGIAR